MRNEKGQGALEYLLLIGGAVLVAAVVIVLLLGINQQSGAQTGITTAGSLCMQDAGVNNTGTASDTNKCGDKVLGSSPENRAADQRQITISGKTYNCVGNFPNCTAV
ncbi:Class III signal peptide [uncultured archaeon]|nr:Class III signal peptide [uncultured archaeon]